MKAKDNNDDLNRSDLVGAIEYRKQSEIFKNYQKAVYSAVGEDKKLAEKTLEKLKTATSLSEMHKIAGEYAIDKEPYVRQVGLRVLCSVGSYFSTGANFAYYAMQLKSDIIAFAVENNYQIEEKAVNEKLALLS